MKKISSDCLLLDVNVLLALAWPNHQFHSEAVRTMREGQSWATCALTQLGFLRLSSNPAMTAGAVAPAEAASLLEAMVSDPLHVYIEAMPSPMASGWQSAMRRVLGHRQVTDAYLLALAQSTGTIFATFDGRLKNLAGTHARVRILG